MWDLDNSKFKKLIEEKIKKKGDNTLIKIIVPQKKSGPSRTFYIFKGTLEGAKESSKSEKNYEIASEFEKRKRPVLYFSDLNKCIKKLKQIEDKEKLNGKYIPGYWFIWDHTKGDSQKLDAKGIILNQKIGKL